MNQFDKFLSEIKLSYPKLEVKYKDESNFMKLLSKILFFNKKFMTKYTTTIGNTVYFPNHTVIEKDPFGYSIVLAHECTHIKDSSKFSSPIYSLMYLSPQIFAILVIPMAFLLGWWALLFLLFLAPIPSLGRMYLEVRGYTMTLFVVDWHLREMGVSEDERLIILNEKAAEIDSNYFLGADYYFMWPFGLKARFGTIINLINSGDILDTDESFRIVAKALESSRTNLGNT